MADRSAIITANSLTAPIVDVRAARTEMTKSIVGGGGLGQLLPNDAVREVIAYMQDGYAEQEMLKAGGAQIIPFPGKKPVPDRGMQSVRFDEWQVAVQGDYWDRPSALSFDSLRSMVEQTPVLNAVIMTRIRQVQRFCRVSEKNTDAPGFSIRHMDRNHQLTEAEGTSIELLNRFIMNCGWEFSPRRRKALRRDSFAQFMAKSVRDSLTMDSAPIETEWKRDSKLGMDGFYSVDGSTIRLCTENGYQGDDEIFALQVVQGRIETAYTFENLIYEARNPRADVRACGYGLSETELLIRVVTGFLNAMTYNIKGFDQNSIPKGLLHISGGYDEKDLNAFKRYWNSMVKGLNNAWSLPVMVSKDQDSKASFEKFGVDFDEMYFAKWMTFLTSIICAIYGMSPSEINFDSFTGGSTSALSGSDTAEKLAASKDSGLRPLLSYYESLITDYLVTDFSDKFVFRWDGLDPQDGQQKFEARKLTLTVNEMRAQDGEEPMEDDLLGNAPVNPALMQVYMQSIGAGQEEGGDFGKDPGSTVQPDEDDGNGGEGGEPTGDDGADPGAKEPDDAADLPPDNTVMGDDDASFGKSMPSVYVLS